MPSLNDAVNPYDAGKAITQSEPSTNGGGGSAYFNLTDPMAGSQASRYSGYFQPGSQGQQVLKDPQNADKPISFGLQRNNEVAGLGQIPGLNYGGTINGATSLQDIITQRQGMRDQTTQSLNQLEDQAGIHEQFTQGLAPNGMSRLALIGRLQNQFGPGWRTDTRAQQVLSQFDSVLGQGNDIGTLNDLIDQGKTALDFLKSQPSPVTFDLVAKSGDQQLASTPWSDRSNGNAQLSWFQNAGMPVNQQRAMALNDFMAGGKLG